MRTTLIPIAVCSALLLGAHAHAASSSSSSTAEGRRPPGPPPEAIAACTGKSEGAEVSFTGRNGETLSGICRSHDGKLAAAPKDMPGGERKGPPPR